jgi:hypothetical protein
MTYDSFDLRLFFFLICPAEVIVVTHARRIIVNTRRVDVFGFNVYQYAFPGGFFLSLLLTSFVRFHDALLALFIYATRNERSGLRPLGTTLLRFAGPATATRSSGSIEEAKFFRHLAGFVE